MLLVSMLSGRHVDAQPRNGVERSCTEKLLRAPHKTCSYANVASISISFVGKWRPHSLQQKWRKPKFLSHGTPCPTSMPKPRSSGSGVDDAPKTSHRRTLTGRLFARGRKTSQPTRSGATARDHSSNKMVRIHQCQPAKNSTSNITMACHKDLHCGAPGLCLGVFCARPCCLQRCCF